MSTKLHVDDKPYSCQSMQEILRYFVIKNSQLKPFTFVDFTSGSANDKSISYQCIDLNARRIAALLQMRGKTGDRVLLLYPAGLDYLCAFFGCIYAGMIAVPAYPPLNERLQYRLSQIADNCEAKIALSNDSIISSLAEVNNITPKLNKIVWLSTVSGLEGFEHSWHQKYVASDALAFLQYTSGSTGTPKGVKISHKNLLHNLRAIAMSLNYMPDDHHFSWLPPYHDMGFVGALLGSFAASIPVSFMAPSSFLRKPARWLQEISKRKCTISGAPNFAYELCIERIKESELDNVDLTCWQLAFSGAEPVRQETLEKFSRRFKSSGFNEKSFFPCYGMAETTLLVSGGERNSGMRLKYLAGSEWLDGKHPPSDTKKIVSCGNVAEGFSVKIVEPETLKILPDGRIGEIYIASDSVSSGYWENDEKTSQSYNLKVDEGENNYFRTGDLGSLIKNELLLCGRMKDLIIINGVNIYPHDVEDTVSACHADIRKGCGIAFSVDFEGKENLVFVQEVNQNDYVEFENLISNINYAISSVFSVSPKYIVLIRNGSIPKTTSGKLSRRPCREKFLLNQLDVVKVWKSLF